MKTKSLSLLGLIALPLILSCSNVKYHIDEESITLTVDGPGDTTDSTWNSATKTLTVNDDYFQFVYKIKEQHTKYEYYQEDDDLQKQSGTFAIVTPKNFTEWPGTFEGFFELINQDKIFANEGLLLIGNEDIVINNKYEGGCNLMHSIGQAATGEYNLWFTYESYIVIEQTTFSLALGKKEIAFQFNIVNNLIN